MTKKSDKFWTVPFTGLPLFYVFVLFSLFSFTSTFSVYTLVYPFARFSPFASPYPLVCFWIICSRTTKKVFFWVCRGYLAYWIQFLGKCIFRSTASITTIDDILPILLPLFPHTKWSTAYEADLRLTILTTIEHFHESYDRENSNEGKKNPELSRENFYFIFSFLIRNSIPNVPTLWSSHIREGVTSIKFSRINDGPDIPHSRSHKSFRFRILTPSSPTHIKSGLLSKCSSQGQPLNWFLPSPDKSIHIEFNHSWAYLFGKSLSGSILSKRLERTKNNLLNTMLGGLLDARSAAMSRSTSWSGFLLPQRNTCIARSAVVGEGAGPTTFFIFSIFCIGRAILWLIWTPSAINFWISAALRVYIHSGDSRVSGTHGFIDIFWKLQK